MDEFDDDPEYQQLLKEQEEFFSNKSFERPAAIPSAVSVYSNGNTVTESSAAHSTKKKLDVQSLLLKETVLERTVAPPSFPTFPSLPSVRGFPKPVHRASEDLKIQNRSFKSNFKKSTLPSELEKQKTPPLVPAGTVKSPMNNSVDLVDENIHEENMARISAMSTEEILNTQEEITEKFDPKLIAMLRARAEKKYAPVNPGSETIEPSGSKAQASAISNIFSHLSIPSDKLEPEKLEWMSDPMTEVSPGPVNIDPSTEASILRFSFDGSFITSPTPTHLGLHHHGDDPTQAGYTISELHQLARSTVPAQRTMALTTLTHIIRMVRVTTLPKLLPDKIALLLLQLDFPLLLRLALDDSHTSTVAAAVTALACFLGYEADDDDVYVWGSAESLADAHSCMGPEVALGVWVNSQDSGDVAAIKGVFDRDLISAFVHTGLHVRLQHLVGTAGSWTVKFAVLRVLIRMVRHSVEVASRLVAECKDIVEILVRLVVDAEVLPEFVVLKLLRLLCGAVKSVAEDVVSRKEFTDKLVSVIAKFTKPFTDESVNVMRLKTKQILVHREIMLLFAVLFNYGLGSDIFLRNHDGLFLITQKLQQRVPVSEDSVSDSDRHNVMFVSAHFKALASVCHLYNQQQQKLVGDNKKEDILYRFALCALVHEKRFAFLLGESGRFDKWYKMLAWTSVLSFTRAYVEYRKTVDQEGGSGALLKIGYVIADTDEMLVVAWTFSPGFALCVGNVLDSWEQGCDYVKQFGELVHPSYGEKSTMSSIVLEWLACQLRLLYTSRGKDQRIDHVLLKVVSNEWLLKLITSIEKLSICNRSAAGFLFSYFLCVKEIWDKDRVTRVALLVLKTLSVGNEHMVIEVWQWMFRNLKELAVKPLIMDDGDVVIMEPLEQVYIPVLIDSVALKRSACVEGTESSPPDTQMFEYREEIVDGLRDETWTLGPIRAMLEEVRKTKALSPTEMDVDNEESEDTRRKRAAIAISYVCLNTFVGIQTITKRLRETDGQHSLLLTAGNISNENLATASNISNENLAMLFVMASLVFFLPPTSESATDPFRIDQINDLLSQTLSNLIDLASFKQKDKTLPKWDFDKVTLKLSLPVFQQIYIDLITQFHAVSYSDKVFAKYVVFPTVAVDSMNEQHRLEFWNGFSEPRAIRSLQNVSVEDVKIPGSSWSFESSKDIVAKCVFVLRILKKNDNGAVWKCASEILRSWSTHADGEARKEVEKICGRKVLDEVGLFELFGK
ncbi:RNA polymerase II associated protein 1 [Nowakowskiella sp. JEL0078]|nr:RNA polymerase II associated protein 1 [Nowakowskiella sp. JEL0078]